MEELIFRQITGLLPDAKHLFSTLVFHEGTYYEIKATYHRKYPSKVMYKRWWELKHRRRSEARQALEAHSMDVLRRSGVKPYSFRYMTTVDRPNNRFRHVSAVKVDDEDLKKLLQMNALRRLHTMSEERTREEVIRSVIYGLAPFAFLLEKKQAA
jgi:hypothetical protein